MRCVPSGEAPVAVLAAMAGAHSALGAWPDSKLPLVPASRWPNQVSRPCRLWGRSHGGMPRVRRRWERGPGSGSVHTGPGPASGAAEHSPRGRLGSAVLESLLRSGSIRRNGGGHGGEHAGAALTTSKHGPRSRSLFPDRRLESHVLVWAGRSSWASLPGVQMAIPSLCAHRAVPLRVSAS